MKTYGVVIMDIVGSRKRERRSWLQQQLREAVDAVNRNYQELLVAPVAITLGDEWQLITNSPASSYDLIHAFQRFFWDKQIEFYAGIGIGGLGTEFEQDVREMDGPCFHQARLGLNVAKAQKRDGNICSKRNRVYFYGEGEGLTGFVDPLLAKESAVSLEGPLASVKQLSLGDVINVVIENNEILKSRMTPKQRAVYLDYLRLGTYRKVKERSEAGSIGSISEKLNTAEFFTIQRNHECVRSLLHHYLLAKGAL